MFNTTFNNNVLAVDFTKVVETRNWLIEKECEFTARFCTDDNNAEVVYFELHYAPAEVVDKLNSKFNPVKPEFRKWDEMSGELRVPVDKIKATTYHVNRFDCAYEVRVEGRVAVFTLWEAPARVIDSLQQKCGVEEPEVCEEIEIEFGINFNLPVAFAKCQSMEEVKKVYKELARIIHPDAGGSVEEMQKLNKHKEIAIAYFA